MSATYPLFNAAGQQVNDINFEPSTGNFSVTNFATGNLAAVDSFRSLTTGTAVGIITRGFDLIILDNPLAVQSGQPDYSYRVRYKIGTSTKTMDVVKGKSSVNVRIGSDDITCCFLTLPSTLGFNMEKITENNVDYLEITGNL